MGILDLEDGRYGCLIRFVFVETDGPVPGSGDDVILERERAVDGGFGRLDRV